MLWLVIPTSSNFPNCFVFIVVHGFYNRCRCHLCLSSWELDVQRTGDGASLRWKVPDFHGIGSEQNPGRSNGAFGNIARSLQKQGETSWTWKNEQWTNGALSQMHFGFAIEELHCSSLCRRYSWRPLEFLSIICQSLCFWQIFLWIPCCLSCLAEMWNPNMVTFERCSNHATHQFVIKRHFPIFESSEGTLMASHDGESAAYTM